MEDYLVFASVKVYVLMKKDTFVALDLLNNGLLLTLLALEHSSWWSLEFSKCIIFH